MTDSPAAPDRSLQAQPAREDLNNAAQIADLWSHPFTAPGRYNPQEWYEATNLAFQEIARLIRNALAKLDGASGPPNTQEPR